MWSERLDRATIVRRSKEEATSIDPSDGDQLQIFLEKIKLGLAGGKGSQLALTICADANRPSFVLNITVDLPGGLAPLQWPIRLSAATQPDFMAQVTMPLVQAQHGRLQELASLEEVIKDKDHVIQKLLEKLDEQGTELGQIFPQVAGKVGRKVDRKKAEERVKGLTVFELEAWRKGLGHEQPEEAGDLIREVFAEERDVMPVAATSAPQEEDWWESIKGITVDLGSGKISTKGPSKAKAKSVPERQAQTAPTLSKDETEEEEDAFQVQSTPPRLSPAKSTSKAIRSEPTNLDDSTDEDDDNPDAPSQRSKIPDSFPAASHSPPMPKPKELGTIGSKKAASKPKPKPTPQPPANDDESTADETEPVAPSPAKRKSASPTPDPNPIPTRPKKKFGKIGGKKEAPPPPPAPEAEAESTDSEPPRSPPHRAKHTTPPPASPLKAKKGRIGKIGSNKAAVPPASTPPPAADIPSSPPSTRATPKRKIGHIGGTKKEHDDVKIEHDSQGTRGRGIVQPEEEPEVRETSTERADRKREELKRELEEKARAPIKKKRKF